MRIRLMKRRYKEKNHPPLKHCPFCGEEEDIVMRKEIYDGPCEALIGNVFYYVECMPCDAKGTNAWVSDAEFEGWSSAQEMAAAMWNCRALRNKYLNRLEKKSRYWRYCIKKFFNDGVDK